MSGRRIAAIAILLVGALIGYFVAASEPGLASRVPLIPALSVKLSHSPFRLGLDLSGGSHLIYRADVSKVPANEVSSALDSLRDVIERRVNLFGVAEPIVQLENASFASGQSEHRLIVDLPGITNVEQAIKMIGETPSLVFMTERPEGPEKESILAAYKRFKN